jgi:DNA primase catalytic core
MIPIARDAGSVIAFGGRATEADQVPKYLNSPETPIYSKSRTLYGLNHTKAAVRKLNYAILVEGYFDFAQLVQAGVSPVVASCGTALTPHQAQLLRRFTSKVVLSFDPDAAGQNAAVRSCRAAGERRLRRQRRGAAARRGSRYVRAEARPGRVRRAAQGVGPCLQFLLDRTAAARDLNRRGPPDLPARNAGGGRQDSGCRRARISSRTAWRTKRALPKMWCGPRYVRPPGRARPSCRTA